MKPMAEPRVTANFHVLYAVDRSDYAGTIVNISRSGALIAAEHLAPEVGTQLRLFVLESPDRQIEVEARVVRLTPRGFGAQFLGTPVELLELLEDLGG